MSRGRSHRSLSNRHPSNRQRRETLVRLIALPALLVVILGFQNCAPVVIPAETIPAESIPVVESPPLAAGN